MRDFDPSGIVRGFDPSGIVCAPMACRPGFAPGTMPDGDLEQA